MEIIITLRDGRTVSGVYEGPALWGQLEELRSQLGTGMVREVKFR